jgi:two-component system response regulator AtoC
MKLAPFGSVGTLPPEDVVFGRTKAMQEIREKIEKIADANVPVLIRGESGTGKEVIAKLLHVQSSRREGPFVKVHCPAIPSTLLESELVGYEEGSFTGASHTKPGRIEAAHSGSLFLDEIAELDPGLQVKLLHLLQDGQICRIGAQEMRAVDARLLCATHRPLQEEIEAGRFRQDLFYRINVVTLRLPPLRERKEDIPTLADYFRELYNAKFNCQAPPFPDEMLQGLVSYDWPGNIRELENQVTQYVVLGPQESMTASLQGIDWGSGWGRAQGFFSLRKVARQAAREAQRKVILQVLEANNGNRKQAARALNISYRALLYKIKEVGIPPKRAHAEALSGHSTLSYVN